MKNSEDASSKSPAVWHLLWIVPLFVALVYGVWEYLEIHYMTGVPSSTLHYIYIVRGASTAFIVTLVAVYMVMRDREKHEQELQDTLADLRELDDIKNNFLSNVSHELRTPLTTVNGYVKFMLSLKAGDVSSRQEKYLKIMSQECDRLQHHIEELLFITTLESKPMYLKLEPVDLYDIAKGIRRSMRVKAEQKNLELRYKVDEGLTMNADPNRLIQLMTNLIDNSIKYTSEGGKVLLKITDRGKDINIQVIDSGIGIPTDKQDKVFERFYQVDSSVSREYGGTGLGLAICREIVRASKGTIKITSPISKEDVEELGLVGEQEVIGTGFSIDLPKELEGEQVSE